MVAEFEDVLNVTGYAADLKIWNDKTNDEVSDEEMLDVIKSYMKDVYTSELCLECDCIEYECDCGEYERKFEKACDEFETEFADLDEKYIHDLREECKRHENYVNNLYAELKEKE